MASYLGTEHNMLKVTDSDARDVIPKLPWLYDEPFADSSQIPTYLVCHAADNMLQLHYLGMEEIWRI